MKKFMLMAIAILVAMAGFAQVKFGVQVIGNLSTASLKSEPAVDFNKKSKLLPGLGIVAEYDVSDKLTIRSGINYLQHGLSVNTEIKQPLSIKAMAENKLHYLQVPVNILYNIPAGNKKFYVGAGGYAGYGVSGRSVQTTRLTTQEGNVNVSVERLNAFKKESQSGAGLKRFDAGASALAGVKFQNGVFANIAYQLGLTNISDGDGKYKNRGLQLSVGYLF